MTAKELLKERLLWKAHPVNHYYFTHHHGTPLLLRKNEKPSEPPYTFSHHVELVNLKKLPKKWKFVEAK